MGASTTPGPRPGPPATGAPVARRSAAALAALAAGVVAGGAPLPLAPRPAAAQPAPAAQGVVAGVVTAAGTGRPLADVQVTVQGTRLGTATDSDGRFRLAGVAGTQVTLAVRRIGFRPASVAARVGDLAVRVALAERALELNQVVVTGTAGVAERRAVGNAVSNISVASVTETQPIRSVQDLLTGRAAGVSVIGSSGQVGTGARIRVRGASSLSLSNDPLIYVDGIRVDNAQASGPANQAFGSRSVSRWNDFDPDDIESIEVIKGPAAATLYGTEASNGVIQIITKQGAAGRTSWNVVARGGGNYIADWQDRLFTNYGRVARANGTFDTLTVSPRQLNDSLRARFGNDIFRTGALRDLQLNVSGGTPVVRYFVGAGREENEGAERANRLQRTSVRANVTATPSSSWDVIASLGYTTGRTYLPYESGGGGATWATYFSSPGFLYGSAPAGQPAPGGNPQLGFRSGPPNVYYTAYNLFQDADRFTGSLTFRNRPLRWLDHRLIVGVDRLIEDNQSQGPRNDRIFQTYAAFSDVGGTVGGFLRVNTRNATNTTFDYAANATVGLPGDWRSVTSVGGQFYGRRTGIRELYGENFAAPSTVLSAAATQRLELDDLIENNTLGGFVQEQVIWHDRLFLTAAVRRDDNSAFGTDYPAVTYPKFSASYVLSEEPSLPIPKAFNSLRVRAAYGGSGLQPGAFDAVRAFTLSGTGGFVTPVNLGNPELGPERATELELGLDAGLLDDRYGAELTFFRGRTDDAILSRQAAPSSGFPGLQLFNAGQVDRQGFEWLLRAQPVRVTNATLDLTLSGSTTTYEIRRLAAGVDTVSLTSSVAHVRGRAPGAWFDRRVVSADRDPTTGAIGNVRCDDGRGGSVPCAGAPRVFLGNSVPRYEGSLTAGLTLFRQWRVNSFLDWRGGYKKLDGNRRVRCNLFSLCRENYFPREFDPVTIAEAQGGTAYTSKLIQDASFLRLREVAVSYTLPDRVARQLRGARATVTVAGRNLGLWTRYPWLDPEASFNGGTRGGAFGQWEQNVLPQLRQLVATVNLTF